VQAPAGEDPAADARAEHHGEEVIGVAAGAGRRLGERHEVRVVLDDHRHVGVRGEERRQADVVPRRHEGRQHDPAGRVLDGRGQPHADAGQQRGIQPVLRQQSLHLGPHGGDDRLRVLVGQPRAAHAADDVAREVGDGHGEVAGAEVDRGDGSRLPHDVEPPGATPAAGLLVPALGDEAEAQQRVHADADGGRREARAARDRGARDGALLPDETEHVAHGSGGDLRVLEARGVRGHAVILSTIERSPVKKELLLLATGQ
jgi:hypothetical protein